MDVGGVIEGIGLTKTFVNHRSLRELIVHPLQRATRTRALRGVDIRVARGEIFGLLGPNGAGKTTLIKILCCLILPDEGRATIDGIDTVRENAVKRRIGLVHSDERSFYWRLSARQNLRFFARLYDVPSRRIESRIDELLRRVDLEAAADRPFSGYSSGMKQRVAIARALLHDPPILFMDEPTRSLDPSSARKLRGFVRDELNGRDGKTIVLATHNLREAEMLTDRLAILVRGRALQVGTVDEVRRAAIDDELYALELSGADGSLEGPFRVVEDRRKDGAGVVNVAPHDDADLGAVLQAVLAGGATLRSCTRLEIDLEEAFARLVDRVEDDR